MFKIIKYRIDLIKYTLTHRKALQKIAKEHGYSYPLHDLDKIFLYPILGKHYTQLIHRAWSSHHYRNLDIKDKVQAAFDWECARFTKPDKPLDAYETWKKYYPIVDMGPTLKMLGLYHNEHKPRVYVGCPFSFQYCEVNPDLIRSDFRYKIVGEPFIEQKNLVEDIGNVEYTGPFYYYKKGLDPKSVVESEVIAVKNADIVVLVFPETGNAPGTLAELIYAASLKKRIEVFYVPTTDKTEEDVSSDNLADKINHWYWYPFIQAKTINPTINFHKCETLDQAKESCINFIKTIK